MRITELTIFTYKANYNYGTYAMSGGRVNDGEPSLVIRIRTDSGIEGWAENAPLGSDYLPSSFTGELAALKELGPGILGLDPRSPAAISAMLYRAMMSGIAAKSIIDMACWDILGKSVGLPTHVLLGGCLTKEPSAFCVVVMQLTVGDDPLEDARWMPAILEALPEHIKLFPDANAGWTLEQALTYCRALGQHDLRLMPLEQPCRTLADSAEVGRRTGVPIILDECIFTMADLAAAHAAGITGVNIKISRVGGFTKARVMRDAAVALDMMVTIDDSWGCALTTAENLQMAASTGPDRLRAVDCYAEWTNPMIADAPRMQKSNGGVVPLDTPGNGFGSVDLSFLGEPIFKIAA
ncbi:enolase C-terminal domain-like protein [Aspergillus pseudotamarii]|uniref:Enolase C-terminal domain-like protein n=1 Tax=Aspergillus pseudotamarii TaxID=132259 RepID=A0A5N6SBE6_ASPPS|nr:enolase C-terminal domain-like protein [Aspergillus pseudotamarii]KAE8132036.1 enolase C-terminal domain-like protein [Aspergillus pseudotamarii]